MSRAGNQQGSPQPLVWQCQTQVQGPSETTRRTPLSSKVAQAYLLGALHDGTWNRANQRIRFAPKGTNWLKLLQTTLRHGGYASWMYQEGKSRDVYVLETVAHFLDTHFDPHGFVTREEKIAYLRGFFDAEGGIPRKAKLLRRRMKI